MTENKPIKSEEELANAFDQLFDEIPSPHTSEEIDEYIREAGINPEKFGAYIKEVASKALIESPLNWRNRDKDEIDLARTQLENTNKMLGKDRESLLSTIDRVIQQLSAANRSYLQVRYRNQADLSDEDLVSLLQELKFMAEKSNIKMDLGE